MDNNDIHKCVRLLEEIRDNQKLQLDRQAEVFALQRDQLAIVQKQAERAERIQDRAEQLQASSAQLVGGARRAVTIILPLVIALIIYLSWLIFRH